MTMHMSKGNNHAPNHYKTIFDIWIISFLKGEVSVLSECQKGIVEINLHLNHQFCEKETKKQRL